MDIGLQVPDVQLAVAVTEVLSDPEATKPYLVLPEFTKLIVKEQEGRTEIGWLAPSPAMKTGEAEQPLIVKVGVPAPRSAGVSEMGWMTGETGGDPGDPTTTVAAVELTEAPVPSLTPRMNDHVPVAVNWSVVNVWEEEVAPATRVKVDAPGASSNHR